jgi:hypothetical protein
MVFLICYGHISSWIDTIQNISGSWCWYCGNMYHYIAINLDLGVQTAAKSQEKNNYPTQAFANVEK